MSEFGSLCLSRKRNESFVIGDGVIEVTVIEIRGDKCRLLISAPKELPVHRREVFDAIKRGEKRKPKHEPLPPLPSLDVQQAQVQT